MAVGPPYDPRGVANLLLDFAATYRDGLTNLELQKLLYFAHAQYLIKTGCPLLSGCFEAWQFGPVHPSVYHAFKGAGDQRITFRAVGTDPITGTKYFVSPPESAEVSSLLDQVLKSYGTLSPGRLVEISHAPNAPWDFVVNKTKTSLAFGPRITDNLIVERFKYHKVSVGSQPRYGEPSEDTPLT